VVPFPLPIQTTEEGKVEEGKLEKEGVKEEGVEETSLPDPTPTTAASHPTVSLIRPRDRNGRKVEDRLSSEDVEAALREYKACVADSEAAVREVLRNLSQRVGGSLGALLNITAFSLVARSLGHHADEAVRKGWCVPSVSVSARSSVSVQSARGGGGRNLDLEGFMPYWLTRPAVVDNTLTMHSMQLLTGPNMAGKSTVLRSLAACALCANVGLMVPGTLLLSFAL
jgi:DNA mismatch repair ATPase MutS